MKKLFFVSLSLAVALISCGTSPLYPKKLPLTLKAGDLVFQDLDCGTLCDAIESVTQKKGYPRLSHVAVVETVDSRGVTLIEALGKVRRVSFKEFAKRSRDSSGRAKILVARLRQKYLPHIPFFLAEVRMRLGRPYDTDFLPDNGKYYCSELISDAMASIGVDLFPRHPITFGASGSKARKIWEENFKKRGKIVPEGAMGTNPIDILTSPFVKIIYKYSD